VVCSAIFGSGGKKGVDFLQKHHSGHDN